jgi:hypothetical protein
MLNVSHIHSKFYQLKLSFGTEVYKRTVSVDIRPYVILYSANNVNY